MLATPTLGCAPRNRGDLLAQLFGDRLRFTGLSHLGDQDSSPPTRCDDAASAGGLTQFVGDGDQDAVECGVAPSVVDLLEAIEIDDDRVAPWASATLVRVCRRLRARGLGYSVGDRKVRTHE
jgi:hypothetical protein